MDSRRFFEGRVTRAGRGKGRFWRVLLLQGIAAAAIFAALLLLSKAGMPEADSVLYAVKEAVERDFSGEIGGGLQSVFNLFK